jgi:acetyltransferase-like isoleucine patch superfamily enzyme
LKRERAEKSLMAHFQRWWLSMYLRLSAWRGYVRAFGYQLLGARMGAKVSIAGDSSILRPWRLACGERCTFERSVAVKIVGEAATVVLGKRVFLGTGTILDVQEGVSIGDDVLLAPGTFITDHNHGLKPGATISDQPCEVRPVVIERGAWLGRNATVLPGVTIGEGAVVGAGSVVTKSVPPYEIWAGVPAKKIGSRKHEACATSI